MNDFISCVKNLKIGFVHYYVREKRNKDSEICPKGRLK